MKKETKIESVNSDDKRRKVSENTVKHFKGETTVTIPFWTSPIRIEKSLVDVIKDRRQPT